MLVKSVGSKVPLKNTVFKLSSTPAAIKCLSCTVTYSTDFVPVTVISPAKKVLVFMLAPVPSILKKKGSLAPSEIINVP